MCFTYVCVCLSHLPAQPCAIEEHPLAGLINGISCWSARVLMIIFHDSHMAVCRPLMVFRPESNVVCVFWASGSGRALAGAEITVCRMTKVHWGVEKIVTLSDELFIFFYEDAFPKQAYNLIFEEGKNRVGPQICVCTRLVQSGRAWKVQVHRTLLSAVGKLVWKRSTEEWTFLCATEALKNKIQLCNSVFSTEENSLTDKNQKKTNRTKKL